MSEWLPIPGWEGYYEVSDDRQVRSVPRIDRRGRKHPGGIKSQPANVRSGYRYVGLCRNGKSVLMTTHSAVMLAFVGPPNGLVVRHLDGNKENNHLSNLAYGTSSENAYDTVLHGRNVNAAKTHCKRGHEFTDENIYRTANGGRDCRRCMAIRSQWRRERKAAA